MSRNTIARAVSAGVVIVTAVLAAACAGSRPDPSDRAAALAEQPPVVAVVDTGVDPRSSFGGMLDRRSSRSLVAGETLDDADGHGTAMASVVHANAPTARIVAVKASGFDGSSDDRLAAAVAHAVDVDASVILIAMTGAQPLPATQHAIEQAGRAGALVVVAAGNDGADLEVHPSYPAAGGSHHVIAVAAVDDDGRVLGSSNRGGSAVAQGLGVGVPACGPDGAPMTVGGTSAAAALVAARASTLLDQGSLTAPQLRRNLEGSPVLDAAPADCAG